MDDHSGRVDYGNERWTGRGLEPSGKRPGRATGELVPAPPRLALAARARASSRSARRWRRTTALGCASQEVRQPPGAASTSSTEGSRRRRSAPGTLRHGRTIHARPRGILAAMGRERPPDFADRLPRLVPKEEKDISHLSDEMADILYPGRRSASLPDRPHLRGVRRPPSARARWSWRGGRPSIARRRSALGPVHHAAFDAASARTLRDLFELVGRNAGHRGGRGRQANPLRARAVAAPVLDLRRGRGARSLEKMPLAEDLEAIDKQIRQLQIEWDKFFGGIEKKPPTDLRSRRWRRSSAATRTRRSATTPSASATRPMVAKYNTFNELWSKKLRAREEGKAFGVHGLKADVLPPPPPPPASAPGRAAARRGRERGFRVQNPERDLDAVRALYDNFLGRAAAGGRERTRQVRELPEADRPAGLAHPRRQGGPGRGLPPRDQGRQGLPEGQGRQVAPCAALSS